MEYKQVEIKLAELKVVDSDGAQGVFKGYASIFGKRDLQDDIVEPGAFKRTLDQKKGRFPVLFQHDPMEPIGQVVEAAEDNRGLRITGQLALGVRRGAETLELLKSKIIQGLSIGYRAVVHEMNNETGTRHLKEIELFEISPVVFPANPHALISEAASWRGWRLPRRDSAFDWDAVDDRPSYLDSTRRRGGPFDWVDDAEERQRRRRR